uniref:Venom gland peptide U14-PHTX-Pmx1d n=1 Tax=Loxosceles reclusa TaxID=6921 RepID=A0A6B9KE28_LOXRE|nr:venom gland peptide U14-PHTX-Pmx1d [Loxosceles reclusa]
MELENRPSNEANEFFLITILLVCEAYLLAMNDYFIKENNDIKVHSHGRQAKDCIDDDKEPCNKSNGRECCPYRRNGVWNYTSECRCSPNPWSWDRCHCRTIKKVNG